MPDDNDMPWEYWDDGSWDPEISREDKEIIKELNKLRDRNNYGKLSDEKFFSAIDRIEFIDWLTDYELSEIDRRNKESALKKEKIENEEKRRKIEKERAKKEFNDSFGCLVSILFLIAILAGIISGILDN